MLHNSREVNRRRLFSPLKTPKTKHDKEARRCGRCPGVFLLIRIAFICMIRLSLMFYGLDTCSFRKNLKNRMGITSWNARQIQNQ